MQFPSKEQLSVPIPNRVWRLFSNPARHTTQAFCRDASGRRLDATDNRAVCWSLPVAMHIVYKGNVEWLVHHLETLHSMFGPRLHDLNDNTPLPDLVLLLQSLDI